MPDPDAYLFAVRPVQTDDREWIRRLVRDRWAAEIVVVHGAVFHPHELPGFLAASGLEKVGLVTYAVTGTECEIVTLDSLKPGRGIGSTLVASVEDAARQAGCSLLRLTTTNDNLNALRFYQKRGFALTALRPGALDATRKLKPIPAVGEHGIPLRDELDLQKPLPSA